MTKKAKQRKGALCRRCKVNRKGEGRFVGYLCAPCYEIPVPRIVGLRLSSWAGISIGAEHYYGALVEFESRREVRLSRVMSTSCAARLRKKDGGRGLYRAGVTTERFDTREQVLRAARSRWQKEFPEAQLLVLGDGVAFEPHIPIDGWPEMVARAALMVRDALEAPGARNLDEDDYERTVDAWSDFVDGITPGTTRARRTNRRGYSS